jgi:CBS-domain-containing membrane protein
MKKFMLWKGMTQRVMNAGPPNLPLSRGNWSLSRYLAERSPAPMPPVVRHVAKLAVNAPLPRAVYVLDESDRLLGMIDDGDLARRIFEHIDQSCYLDTHPFPGTYLLQLSESATTIDAASLMNDQRLTISEQDTLNTAMHALYRTKLDELPVVDDHGQLLGVIRALDIVREWTEDALLTRLGDETEPFY